MEEEEATEKMDVDETSRKRRLESKERRIQKAGTCTDVIQNITELFNMTSFTIPMIQQQMIMHGVDFNPQAKREDLRMEIERAIAFKRWADDVEEQTIRKRFKRYEEEKGPLPIAVIIEPDTGASGSQDKPRKSRKERTDKQKEAEPDTGASGSQDNPRKSRKERTDKQKEAEPEADTGASASNEARKRAASTKPKVSKTKEKKKRASSAQPPEESGNEPSDEDIPQFQQQRILIPSKATIATLRVFLIKAFNVGKITDKDDVQIYKDNSNFIAHVKSKDKSQKEFIMKYLRYLYKTYVFDPRKTREIKESTNKSKTC